MATGKIVQIIGAVVDVEFHRAKYLVYMTL